MYTCLLALRWQFGVVGSDFGQINKVGLCLVSTGIGNHIGSAPGARNLSRSNQPLRSTQSLSLAIPLWVGTMSTGQRAVMLTADV